MGYNRLSTWLPLTDESLDEVPNDPGVYQIRVKRGKGIPRLLGVEPLGILDIGESVHFRTRLRNFLRCATSSKAVAHVAGWRFRYLRLHRKGFSVEVLEFRWKALDSKKEAQIAEGQLMREYVRDYGELPPLNYRFTWFEKE